MTREEIQEVVDQADQIKHRVDDEQMSRKDLKKMITVLEENFATN